MGCSTATMSAALLLPSLFRFWRTGQAVIKVLGSSPPRLVILGEFGEFAFRSFSMAIERQVTKIIAIRIVGYENPNRSVLCNVPCVIMLLQVRCKRTSDGQVKGNGNELTGHLAPKPSQCSGVSLLDHTEWANCLIGLSMVLQISYFQSLQWIFL